jgi:3-hydroxyisobutyrate dehydrogenase-like beta-hydroxyacid dehydrogenase
LTAPFRENYNAAVRAETSTASLEVALFGLGEAGSAVAEDLVRAGVRVVAWDPQPRRLPKGVALAREPLEAVAAAHVVLVLTTPRASLQVAEALRDHLRPGQVYADCNSTSPAVKRQAAAVVHPSGALFADVALMAPVPGRGLRTPAVVSGPGAEALAARLGPLGMPVQVVGPEVGAAAARKLVRSVFMKGLAAAVVEALAAARALGCEQEVYRDISRTLEEADGALLRRLVEGTRAHAARRVDEMRAACELLEELGVPPRVARASAAWLEELAEAG